MDLYGTGILDGLDHTIAHEITQLYDKPLKYCRLSHLQVAVEKSSSEMIGLADGNRFPSLREWKVAAEKLQENNAAAVILYPENGMRANIWKKAPLEVATLVASPSATAAVLISRDLFSQELSQLNAADDFQDPLWSVLHNSAKADRLMALPSAISCHWKDEELPELAPDHPARGLNWLKAAIQECCSDTELGTPLKRTLLRAGLFQLHDFLNESHEASQSIEGNVQGDHWHAIMHRREPDYGNSKYWYRHVGSTSIFIDLNDWALRLRKELPVNSVTNEQIGAGTQWDPFSFVDFCSNCERNRNQEAVKLARQIQYLEMLLLLQTTL
ncbi:MAG: hypothetical protein R3C11_01875 [Planctomycetaceae bacterium]